MSLFDLRLLIITLISSDTLQNKSNHSLQECNLDVDLTCDPRFPCKKPDLSHFSPLSCDIDLHGFLLDLGLDHERKHSVNSVIVGINIILTQFHFHLPFMYCNGGVMVSVR